MKASYVKNTLLKTLFYMDQERSSFVKRPGFDFSRHRKCSFQDVLLCLLTMENHSLNRELRHFFQASDISLTKSAFCQQRAKLNEQALPFLFLSLINVRLSVKSSKVITWSLPMGRMLISLLLRTVRIHLFQLIL